MYKVNTQQINRQLFTIIQRSSISCKLDIENCPEVEIHSNKDLRNGKCRVSTFDESSIYFMSIFCSSKSNLIYTLLCPLCLPIKHIILDPQVVSPSMLTSNL